MGGKCILGSNVGGPWYTANWQGRRTGPPNSAPTLLQSATRPPAPRARQTAGPQRSWAAARRRAAAAPPSSAVSGVGPGLPWGRSGSPSPCRPSAFPLLPGPKLCTYNGTFYGVRAQRRAAGRPWWGPRVPLGHHPSSPCAQPCVPLLPDTRWRGSEHFRAGWGHRRGASARAWWGRGLRPPGRREGSWCWYPTQSPQCPPPSPTFLSTAGGCNLPRSHSLPHVHLPVCGQPGPDRAVRRGCLQHRLSPGEPAHLARPRALACPLGAALSHCAPGPRVGAAAQLLLESCFLPKGDPEAGGLGCGADWGPAQKVRSRRRQGWKQG